MNNHHHQTLARVQRKQRKSQSNDFIDLTSPVVKAASRVPASIHAAMTQGSMSMSPSRGFFGMSTPGKSSFALSSSHTSPPTMTSTTEWANDTSTPMAVSTNMIRSPLGKKSTNSMTTSTFASKSTTGKYTPPNAASGTSIPGYIHVDKENVDDSNKKIPASNKTREERARENWSFYAHLQSVGLTSPVQMSKQESVIELPDTTIMAQLCELQFNNLPKELQNLRGVSNRIPRPNIVYDYKSALNAGFSKDYIINDLTLEELMMSDVMILAINFTVSELYHVVGGQRSTVAALANQDVGTKPTIHRDCMIVVFVTGADDVTKLLSLEEDENAEARLIELRSNATDKAKGTIYVAVMNGKCCLAKFPSLHATDKATGIKNQTLSLNASFDKPYKRHGLTIRYIKDVGEYQALVPIENGTEEMKAIIAKNKKGTIKNNPELVEELQAHFIKHGKKSYQQIAFVNYIVEEYDYSKSCQKNYFDAAWRKKVKDEGIVEKPKGNIESFFTKTRK